MQILSRGLVVKSGVVDARGQHIMTFDIPLTPLMAPTAYVMAYYVRPDMEIVPDSIAFNIEGIFDNKVWGMFEDRTRDKEKRRWKENSQAYDRRLDNLTPQLPV